MSNARVDPRASALHRESIVIDACAPILRDHRFARYWIDGGATCALATVALFKDDTASTLTMIGRVLRNARRHGDAIVAISVDDIIEAKRTGQLAIVLAFQNSSPLAANPDMVEVFYRVGVRSMNLAYNRAEYTADGCLEPRNGGITQIGRRVIAEINRVGMLLDLSHTGYRSTMEAMESSTAPVAFTHSNAWNVYAHPRNLRDDQITACVASGGVIGLNGHPAFVKEGTASPTVEDLMAHLLYLVDKAGIDHVGLGLDFSQPPGEQMTAARYQQLLDEDIFPSGTLPPPPWTYPIRDASRLDRLTDEMLRRGFSDEHVRKVLGRNFLDLFRRVWR